MPRDIDAKMYMKRNDKQEYHEHVHDRERMQKKAVSSHASAPAIQSDEQASNDKKLWVHLVPLRVAPVIF